MKHLRYAMSALAIVLGLAIAPVAANHTSAATYMGAGVTCYGTPTYGSNPLITCTQTGSRYATWTVKYAIGGGRCEFWQKYGHAWKWNNGATTVTSLSSTYAYTGWC